jgi:Phage Mu protein F like protein
MKLEFDPELTAVTLRYIDAALHERLDKDLDRATARAIERIARRFEPALRDAFLAAIRSARQQATLNTIAEAMRTLNPAAAIREATAGLEYDRMRETLAQIVEAAGQKATTALQTQVGPVGGRILADFDIVNPYAVGYARTEVGRLIRQIDTGTLEGIQRLIGDAIENGIPPRETARRIKNGIGLTEYQTNVVLNYENKLLAAGATNIDAKVQRYADKVLGQRALTIARTETLSAANGGQQAAWEAAKDQGFLTGDEKQQWIITRDDRLCEICAPMPILPENQNVKIGGRFLTGDGRYVKRPPETHPQCRCAIGLVL